MKLIAILLLTNILWAKQYLAPVKKDTDWQSVAQRCLVTNAETLFAQDFNFDTFTTYSNNRWFTNQKGMAIRYQQLYQSQKRPIGRAYYNPQLNQFSLPLNQGAWDNETRVVKLNPRFIENVTIHIEEALKRGYAQFIFFPDMGHNHFYVSKEFFDHNIAPISDIQAIYQALFDFPGLKMFYHTAEKLRLEDGEGPLDPIDYRRFRYNSRNIIGDNSYQGVLEILYNYSGKYNSVSSYKDLASYSAGIFFHASKNGCFPFNDGSTIKYFDITLQYFPYENLN